jgi:hypothetical protein
MREEFKKWEPVEGLEAEMWVEALYDDYEGLRILLKGNISSAILRFSFKHYYLYRNVDESYRLKLWREGNFDEMRWVFYKASASNLINWVYEESEEIYPKEEMVHYLIKTGADVIEVISKIPPAVEWLNNGSSHQINGAVVIKKGKRGSYNDKL